MTNSFIQGTPENTKKEEDCFACKLYKQHHSEFQNKYVIILPNHFPYGGEEKTHTIILPARHIHKLSELSEEERDAFYHYWRELALCYEKVLHSSFSFSRNNTGGSSVWHLHAHVTKSDGFIGNFSRGEYKGLNEELRKLIKNLK